MVTFESTSRRVQVILHTTPGDERSDEGFSFTLIRPHINMKMKFFVPMLYRSQTGCLPVLCVAGVHTELDDGRVAYSIRTLKID